MVGGGGFPNKVKERDMGHGTWATRMAGTWDVGRGTRDIGRGTRAWMRRGTCDAGRGPRAWMRRGTCDAGRGARD